MQCSGLSIQLLSSFCRRALFLRGLVKSSETDDVWIWKEVSFSIKRKFLLLFLLLILQFPEDVWASEEDFLIAWNTNAKSLATTLDKDTPASAKPGSTDEMKRTLIALASLLMETSGCAAVFVRGENVWIGANESSKRLKDTVKLIEVFFKSDEKVEPHRKSILENSTLKKILEKSISRRASQEKGKTVVVRNSEIMIHWLKKIVQLKKQLNKNTDTGRLAEKLKNGKVKYFTKYHAEMNILQELYDNQEIQIDEGEFLGISKKCCLKCAAVLQATNNVYSKLPYKTNGSHFKLYDWPMPQFVKDDKKILKEFLGKEAYKIYEKKDKKEKEVLLQKIEKYATDKGGKTAQLATETESQHEIILTSNEDGGYSITKGKMKTKVKVGTRNKKKGKKPKKLSSSSTSVFVKVAKKESAGKKPRKKK